MADTQLDATLSASEPISGNLSANEGINASLAPDEEVSGALEVKRTRTVATMLSELADVELDDLHDDDILVYDSLDGKWHNEEQTAGGGTWGTITGTLSDQTDLQDALDGKYDVGDTPETDIQDEDYIPFYDNSASAKKNSLWSNIKAKLNEMFFRRSEQRVLGAKNLLHIPPATYRGVDISKQADGSYKCSGTTENAVIRILNPDTDVFKLPVGRYIYSHYSSDGHTSRISYVENDTWRALYDGEIASGTEVEFEITPALADCEIGITIRNYTVGASVDTVIKPMIRLATDPDSTFEPFALTNKQLTDKFGTLGSASTKDVPASGDAGQTEVVLGSDTRLTDARTPTSHTHTTSEITDFPTLATVATSGSYNDLSNTPTIPDELADLSDDATHRLVTDTEKSAWNNKCDNSVVAFVESGSTASQAYAKGEHFIRDGAYCTAKTAIALGTVFTLGTNYTAGTISDDLNPQKISTSTTPSLTLASGVTSNGTAADNVFAIKMGNIVFLKLRVYMSLSTGWNLAATLPSGYYPSGQNLEFTANNIDLDVQYNARFETDGRIQVYNPSAAASNKRISITLTYFLG